MNSSSAIMATIAYCIFGGWTGDKVGVGKVWRSGEVVKT
jgi:hypothetical protein